MLTKAEVAARQATKSGGGFNDALGRLQTLELVQWRSHLRASENLFYETLAEFGTTSITLEFCVVLRALGATEMRTTLCAIPAFKFEANRPSASRL